jgi:hypothetical protein
VIGEGAKPKYFQNHFLKNWRGLERAKKMINMSRVWVVVDKNQLMRSWAAAILKIRGIQLWQLYDQLFVYDQLFACHFV